MLDKNRSFSSRQSSRSDRSKMANSSSERSKDLRALTAGHSYPINIIEFKTTVSGERVVVDLDDVGEVCLTTKITDYLRSRFDDFKELQKIVADGLAMLKYIGGWHCEFIYIGE